MKKIILILTLTMIVLSASALASTNYVIDEVRLDNNKLNNEFVRVELGSTINLEIKIRGQGYLVEDVKVRAEIPGYEYGEISAVTSEPIRITPNINYNVPLQLTIPEDLDLSNNNYRLHVRIFGRNGYEEKTYNLFIEEKRNDLRINDVILWPGNEINQGERLYVKTRLQNYGYKTIENIRLQFSIDELGVSNVEWINRLDSGNAITTKNVPLRIPAQTITGDYQLTLKIFENNRLVSEEKVNIKINGIENTETKAEIIFDKGQSELDVGQEMTYKILIANMDTSKNIYTVNINNANLWSDYEISQNMISLNSKDVAEIRVKLIPTETGYKQFSISVEENGNKIAESYYQVKVNDKNSINHEFDTFLLISGIGIIIITIITLMALFVNKKRIEKTVEPKQQKPLY